MLKRRKGIENSFSYLKCYNRVCVRRDRKIEYYLGFVFLGCIKYLSASVTNKIIRG